MDMVIFTGRVSEHELPHERPAEYAREAGGPTLADAGAPSPRSWLDRPGGSGTTAVLLGLTLSRSILYAVASQG